MARARERLVLDAAPIVNVLIDDTAAPQVIAALAGQECVVSVVNAAEVLDVVTRVHGVPPESAAESVDRFLDEVARPVPVTRALALTAATLRARHYHRKHRDVSLADCIAIATALPDARVATSDAGVAAVARAEGLEVILLPDSHGSSSQPSS